MGVYIKGMEMPKKPVLFCIHPDGKVFADLEGGWGEYNAVPVPPHGDLVDINALKLAILDVDYVNKHDYLKGVLNAINHAPTVIEASGVET